MGALSSSGGRLLQFVSRNSYGCPLTLIESHTHTLSLTTKAFDKFCIEYFDFDKGSRHDHAAWRAKQGGG